MGSQFQSYTFVSYLLSNNKFLNSLRILYPILLYFKIFENCYFLRVKTLPLNDICYKVTQTVKSWPKQLKKGFTLTGK